MLFQNHINPVILPAVDALDHGWWESGAHEHQIHHQSVRATVAVDKLLYINAKQGRHVWRPCFCMGCALFYGVV
jgi:hypothetical protein